MDPGLMDPDAPDRAADAIDYGRVVFRCHDGEKLAVSGGELDGILELAQLSALVRRLMEDTEGKCVVPLPEGVTRQVVADAAATARAAAYPAAVFSTLPSWDRAVRVLRLGHLLELGGDWFLHFDVRNDADEEVEVGLDNMLALLEHGRVHPEVMCAPDNPIKCAWAGAMQYEDFMDEPKPQLFDAIMDAMDAVSGGSRSWLRAWRLTFGDDESLDVYDATCDVLGLAQGPRPRARMYTLLKEEAGAVSGLLASDNLAMDDVHEVRTSLANMTQMTASILSAAVDGKDAADDEAMRAVLLDRDIGALWDRLIQHPGLPQEAQRLPKWRQSCESEVCFLRDVFFAFAGARGRVGSIPPLPAPLRALASKFWERGTSEFEGVVVQTAAQPGLGLTVAAEMLRYALSLGEDGTAPEYGLMVYNRKLKTATLGRLLFKASASQMFDPAVPAHVKDLLELAVGMAGPAIWARAITAFALSVFHGVIVPSPAPETALKVLGALVDAHAERGAQVTDAVHDALCFSLQLLSRMTVFRSPSDIERILDAGPEGMRATAAARARTARAAMACAASSDSNGVMRMALRYTQLWSNPPVPRRVGLRKREGGRAVVAAAVAKRARK